MATTKQIRRRALSLGILCFLCLFVAAEPFRIANASINQANTMACCMGKTAGHCDSGIPAKKVPPLKSEPMCGLENAVVEDDTITIVAEPVPESRHSHSQTVESTSSQPAAKAASLSSPCPMDCSACATTATRQQKRERGIVHSTNHHAVSPATSSKYEDQSLLFSSSDHWPQTIPRGPPTRR